MQGRSQVHDHQHAPAALPVGPDETQHTVGVIPVVDPLEPIGLVIPAPEGRFASVCVIQITHPPLDTGMERPLLQKPPIDLAIHIPFGNLTQLATHEDQLLAREEPLITQHCAQVGEGLPVIARHAATERTLSMDHFIMRERQHEILMPVVEHGEGQIILMIAPMDGIPAKITQRVVHPPHVPLQGETQPTNPRRPRHHGPRGALFSDGDHARELDPDMMVESL